MHRNGWQRLGRASGVAARRPPLSSLIYSMRALSSAGASRTADARRWTPTPANLLSETYTAALREVSLLSRDDYLRRLHRFSRVSFDPADGEAAHAYLHEAVQHRMDALPAKVAHDVTQLAHVAGFHEMCLALFHARCRSRAKAVGSPVGPAAPPCFADRDEQQQLQADGAPVSRATVPDAAAAAHTATSGDGALPPPARKHVLHVLASSSVVESAYALGSGRQLLGIASYCAACAREDQAGGRPVEAMTTFSLLRCLWRAVCLSEMLRRADGTTLAPAASFASLSPGRPTADVSGDADDALEIARTIARDYVLPTHRPTATAAATVLPPVERLLRVIARIVKYDSSGDSGEMAFFRRCLRDGLLAVPTVTTAPPPTGTAETNDGELFTASLIETCVAGGHTEVALTYYDAACEDSIPAALLRLARGGGSGQRSPPGGVEGTDGRATADADDTAVAARARAPAADPPRLPSEYVLYRLLTVLQRAHDNERVVAVARSVLRLESLQRGASPAASISVSVWSLILVAAGECRAVDLALAAYESARDRLRLEPVVGAGRRSLEYFMQTALIALSKCQVDDYEERYLAPTREAGLIHCTEEFYFCCLLQAAHNSLSPMEQAAALVTRMESQQLPRTPAIVTRLLKLYLRCESPLFLTTYRRAVDEDGLFRRAWVGELVLWADRRGYLLTQEDRAYILARAAAEDGTEATPSDGHRPQLALLAYDYQVQPRAHFAAHGAPPPTEPSVVDPRLHCLRSRSQRVRQGLAGSGDESLARAASRVIGDPVRAESLARRTTLTGQTLLTPLPPSSPTALPEAPLAPLEKEWHEESVRVYLSELLRGLQRSRNSTT